MTAPIATRDYFNFRASQTNLVLIWTNYSAIQRQQMGALRFNWTHNTLREAVEFHWVSIPVPRRSHQNQTPSNPLLRHNQTLPLLRHRRTELLSELRLDGDELSVHGNAPVFLKKKKKMK